MTSEKNFSAKIKEKKELAGISDEVVSEVAEKVLKKYGVKAENLSEKKLKLLTKEAREELRNYVGRFRAGLKNREKLLEKNEISKLLRTHKSTAERTDFYPSLRKKIRALHPRSILDLACGLNPLALASKETTYFATEINEEEIKIIKKFFRKKGINGRAFIFDIRSSPKNLPKAELCLVLKTLDIIGENRNEITKNLLKELKCEKLIASFSTKKLSGKKMNSPKRFWFEKILFALKLDYDTFFSENEIFYLINLRSEKNSSRTRN